jgi:mono/diheme cytochrome c family protein
VLLAGGVLAVAAVLAQGYLGGRMTYDQGVGIDSGGQFAQTATGARRLDVALARGTAPAAAGRQAFARSGLGCASCHGDQAEGQRGPNLAGGRDVEEFRRVHATGLFPPSVVSDRDFAAIDAWLRTLRRNPSQRG